ncbi:hypothetical protein VPHK469_0083 [Vibrio phage K469]
MANELDKILGDIKSARERRASQDEITNLAKRVDQAANASMSAAEMANGLAKNFSKNMASMVPGRSAITAAITANNPLLAGAAQLIGDMKRTQQEASAVAREGRQEMLSELQQQLSGLQESGTEEQKQPKAEPQDGVSDKLEAIKSELKFDELEQIGRDQLNVLNSLFKEWTGSDHEIITAMNKQAAESEMLRKIAEETRQAEAEAYAEDRLRSSEEVGGNAPKFSPDGSGVGGEVETPQLGAIGSLLGGLGGLSTLAVNMLKPLRKVLKLFRVGPMALIAAAWDFGEGFLNASEILGKDDVQITDRIQAGVANIMGGIGELGDWIAGLFGFETDIQAFLTNNTIDLTQPLVDGLNKITGFLSQMWDGVTPDTAVMDIPSLVWGNIETMTQNALQAVMDYDWGDAGDQLQDTMGQFWDYTLDKLKGLFSFFGDDGEGDNPKKKRTGFTGGYDKYNTTNKPAYQYHTERPGTARVGTLKEMNEQEKRMEKAKQQERERKEKEKEAKTDAVIQTNLNNNVTNQTTVTSKGIDTLDPRKSAFGLFD